MKRLISLILIISILYVCTIPTSAICISENSDLVVIHDKEKNERIDALFAYRAELEIDYDENMEQINKIDLELAKLGVENISGAELLNKLGVDALPAVNVTFTSSTSWTSRRIIVSFRSTQYELQIIEGMPIDGEGENSPLECTSVGVTYEAAGAAAGAIEAVKVLGAVALGEAPVVGDALTVMMTAYDLLKVGWDSIKTSTVIDDITGSITVTMTTHMKYIFVKSYGSSDDYQILCYIGNYVNYLYTSVIPYDIPNDGEGSIHITYTSDKDVIHSAYYNDYSVATNNYYNARNNPTTEMIFMYNVTYLRLWLRGQKIRFSVPIDDAPLT